MAGSQRSHASPGSKEDWWLLQFGSALPADHYPVGQGRSQAVPGSKQTGLSDWNFYKPVFCCGLPQKQNSIVNPEQD